MDPAMLPQKRAVELVVCTINLLIEHWKGCLKVEEVGFLKVEEVGEGAEAEAEVGVDEEEEGVGLGEWCQSQNITRIPKDMVPEEYE